MNLVTVQCGFIPLVDSAPLVIAREIGFAEEEGIALHLSPAPSWSALRDQLAIGQIDAAHMLAPVPVAMALGLGGMPAKLDVLCLMSVNGNVIGVSNELADKLRAAGHDFGFASAREAGSALREVMEGRLRIGVPFPFSTHAELVYYWLNAMGLPSPEGLDVRTVPPPQMADALSRHEIDAFCVGEPWGSIAVEEGHGSLLLPGAAIWAGAPEKVLAVRQDWTTENLDVAHRLIRAVWRAQRWLYQHDNLSTASEVLARRTYLNMSADIIERAMTGNIIVDGTGSNRRVRGFLRFYEGAAGFPWRSQAVWLADRLAARMGLDRAEAAAAARSVFRTDLYRAALNSTSADMPGASEKVEGTNPHLTPVASQRGTLVLEPDGFFDGAIFDPAEVR